MSHDQTTVKNDSSGCMVSVMALLLATLTVALAIGATSLGQRTSGYAAPPAPAVHTAN